MAPPTKKFEESEWINSIITEADRRMCTAKLINALEASLQDPDVKVEAAPPAASVGKVCSSCGVDLPKEKYSKKQWQVGGARRCVDCVEKTLEGDTSWQTVEKEKPAAK